MKKDCNCNCHKLLKEIMKKIDKLNNGDDNISNFDLDNYTKASKVLSCSLSTVRNAVDTGILQEGIHYRHNGKRKYYFCSKELLKIKGTL